MGLIGNRRYVFGLNNGDFNAKPPLRTDLSGLWARGYRKSELGERLLSLHNADVVVMELVPVVKIRLDKAYTPKSDHLARKTRPRESASEPEMTRAATKAG
jgi:hypothetical protein